ncbi:hypothetical protein CHISP_1857 [Chitinispirillum alkaliphilum]|nr:hypothetical protein CHISP_1857 [Chitinispirillum alkaliphilum]
MFKRYFFSICSCKGKTVSVAWILNVLENTTTLDSKQEREYEVMKNKRKDLQFITLLFFLMVCGLYYFGLRPFDFSPHNQVSSVPDGLKFSRMGIAFTERIITAPYISSFTMEFALTPLEEPSHTVTRIISFADRKGNELLAVGQWKNSIILRRYDKKVQGERVPEVSSGPNLLCSSKVFITIVSDPNRGALFLNGDLMVESAALANIGEIFRSGSQMILGNSPSGIHSWKGIISSLALYSDRLPIYLLREHYHRYLLGLFHYAEFYPPFLHYALCETENFVSVDKTGQNNLVVPENFITVKRGFLVPFWEDFVPNRYYYIDILVNFFGFLPFGAVAFSFFYHLIKKAHKAVALSVLLGFLISFSIETVQIFLPTRHSQMIDLLMNTFGAFAGALLLYKLRIYTLKDIVLQKMPQINKNLRQ